VQLTSLFFSPKEGGRADLLVHIDARDLTAVADLSKNRRLSFTLACAAFNGSGDLGSLPTRTFDFTLTDQEYRWALEFGLVQPLQVGAGSPGGFQIRVLVSDAFSDRFGTAGRFVTVPAITKDGFALSGLSLQGNVPDARPGTRDFWNMKESNAVREFPAGRRLQFSYFIYNPAMGPGKESEIESQIRIFAEGNEMYTGPHAALTLAPNSDPLRREISGTVSLDPTVGPGRYVLLVTVTDKLAPGHTASQYVEFTVVP
jgi:hypothetical protein